MSNRVEWRWNDTDLRYADHAGSSYADIGPWSAEPDKVQWVDDETGLDCLIVRGPMGALCGYVGVPPEHPWHGVRYSQHLDIPCDKTDEDFCYEHSPENLVQVHGGLTFSKACSEDEVEGTGICHIPLPGRPSDVWWFGFDCAHCNDAMPGLRSLMPPGYFLDDPWHDTYRDIEYVTCEVTDLARQLAAVTTVTR